MSSVDLKEPLFSPKGPLPVSEHHPVSELILQWSEMVLFNLKRPSIGLRDPYAGREWISADLRGPSLFDLTSIERVSEGPLLA